MARLTRQNDPMENPGTTAELIAILEAERRACLRGDRLDLQAAYLGHPVYDRFFDTSGAQRYSAFAGFRERVREYQREQGISGLQWQTVDLPEGELHFPEPYIGLDLLAADRLLLAEWRPRLVDLWQTLAAGGDRWRAVPRQRHYEPWTEPGLPPLAAQAEWASLHSSGRAGDRQWQLQLSWGDPEEALTWRSWPESGSEWLVATPQGARPLF